MPAGHNFTFICLRSILILSSLLLMLSLSAVLCCRCSGKILFAYFLTVMRATYSAHLFFDTTSCAVRHPRHWVIVFRIFPLQLFLYLQREKLSETFWPFEKWQFTFSRKVCNELPNNVPSYNRRKGRLFIPLWQPKSYRNCMNFRSNWVE